ncbi:MAG: peptide chain release factor 2 [Clostridia bacterium]|nr:peptide chain release factor 2 [Clostridia bacterium]
MFELDQYSLQLPSMQKNLYDLRDSLDTGGMSNRVEELENKTTEPGFWNDTSRSQEILKEIKLLKDKLAKIQRLSDLYEEIELMIVLGNEENDPDAPEAVGAEVEKFNAELEVLRLETLLTGEYDANNAILTIHPGAGGTEAQDWAEMLMRMYMRWGEAHEYDVKVLDILDGDEAGIKSCSLQFTGINAYGFLKSEHGVHRLVRFSPYNAAGKRQTSFSSVEVMPEIDDTIKIDIRPEDMDISYFRASGAGGQHINKTDSACRIVHKPTGIMVSCQTERSQTQNRETAIKMLMSKLFDIKRRENEELTNELKGEQSDIAFGNAIRSYVFCPYTLVKDRRTNYEDPNVQKVVDGGIDGFINAYLADEFNKRAGGSRQF